MPRPNGRRLRWSWALIVAAVLSLPRRCPGFVDASLVAARSRRNAMIRHASTIEGNEFKAARDRIRRIQLGLSPDDPLPEEDDESVEDERINTR
eukprot:symbB.v1.2.029783.t1/scaffold3297.1/size59542/2